MTLTDAERAAMEAGPAGGTVAYIERIREGHQPRFSVDRMGAVIYAGCSCDNFDSIPYLLIHIDDLKRAYEAKVEDLARETRRSSVLTAALERVLESFTQKATIGEAVVRTGWWYPRHLDELRAALHPESVDSGDGS